MPAENLGRDRPHLERATSRPAPTRNSAVRLEKKGKIAFEGREAPVISEPFDEKGPYYAAKLFPTLLNTQGGPRRNEKGQVLNALGKPIPRLYSAGELGSMWGRVYQGATQQLGSLRVRPHRRPHGGCRKALGLVVESRLGCTNVHPTL